MYLLFSGDYYYPEGGYLDFTGLFDTLEEAQAAATTSPDHWYQIVHDHKIVEEG